MRKCHLPSFYADSGDYSCLFTLDRTDRASQAHCFVFMQHKQIRVALLPAMSSQISCASR